MLNVAKIRENEPSKVFEDFLSKSKNDIKIVEIRNDIFPIEGVETKWKFSYLYATAKYQDYLQ